MTLQRKFGEGLYESETIGVPVGEHTCQLALGGDVVSTEPFTVNEDSDVIFVILKEGKILPLSCFPYTHCLGLWRAAQN